MKIQEATVKRIQQLRKGQKLTIRTLSEKSEISESTLKSILQGTSENPGIASLKKIMKGLGITVRDFFDADIFDDLEPED